MVKEKACGGNNLLARLKDLAHHFQNPDYKRVNILNDLFIFNNDYLKNNLPE